MSKQARDRQVRWAKEMSVGERLIEQLTEFAEAIERDEVEERFTVRDVVLDLEPPEYTSADVKRLRALLNASQPVFAMLIGVRPSTVRSWEQGATPPPIARRLLEIIEDDPGPWLKRLREATRPAGSDAA